MASGEVRHSQSLGMEVLRPGQGLVPAQSHLRASHCPLLPNAFWRIRSTLLTELGNQGAESPWASSRPGQRVGRKALCPVQAVVVWDKPTFGDPGCQQQFAAMPGFDLACPADLHARLLATSWGRALRSQHLQQGLATAYG